MPLYLRAMAMFSLRKTNGETKSHGLDVNGESIWFGLYLFCLHRHSVGGHTSFSLSCLAWKKSGSLKPTKKKGGSHVNTLIWTTFKPNWGISEYESYWTIF